MGRANLDIRTFCEDNQHRIWIGCSEGIYIYDPDKMEVIQHYHSGNSELHGNLIRTIEQDDKGRFWIGTFGDGMEYIAGFSSDQALYTERRILFQYHQSNL